MTMSSHSLESKASPSKGYQAELSDWCATVAWQWSGPGIISEVILK